MPRPTLRLLRSLALLAFGAELCGCGASSAVPVQAPPSASPKAAEKPPRAGELPRPLEAQAASIATAGADPLVDRRAKSSSPIRLPVHPVSFRVADLPLGAIPDAPWSLPIPKDMPQGEPAGLVADWNGLAPDAKAVRARKGVVTVRVTMPQGGLGRLRIGPRNGALSLGAGGGVFAMCGGDAHTIAPMRSETLVADKSGHVELVVADGWFDGNTCEGVVAHRVRIPLTPLAGGALYAFRERCATCATPEVLHVVGPRAQQFVASGLGGEATTSSVGSFSAATLPIQRGGGGSLLVRVAPASMREWREATGFDHVLDREFVLGVELVQGVDEDQPSATVYIAEPSTTSDVAPEGSRPRIFGF